MMKAMNVAKAATKLKRPLKKKPPIDHLAAARAAADEAERLARERAEAAEAKARRLAEAEAARLAAEEAERLRREAAARLRAAELARLAGRNARQIWMETKITDRERARIVFRDLKQEQEKLDLEAAGGRRGRALSP
jgi:hypothetical protein